MIHISIYLRPCWVYRSGDAALTQGRSLKHPGSPSSSESLPDAAQTPSTSASTPGNQLVIQNWRAGAAIGHGSYGSVQRALDVDNGFLFAVKKSTVTQCDEEDRRYLEKLREELEAWKVGRKGEMRGFGGKMRPSSLASCRISDDFRS